MTKIFTLQGGNYNTSQMALYITSQVALYKPSTVLFGRAIDLYNTQLSNIFRNFSRSKNRVIDQGWKEAPFTSIRPSLPLFGRANDLL